MELCYTRVSEGMEGGGRLKIIKCEKCHCKLNLKGYRDVSGRSKGTVK